MNNPDPAVVDNDEATATGAEPDLSLNPHLGRLVEPEGDDQAEAEASEDEAKADDSPSSGEGDTESKPDDSKKVKAVEELAFENRQLKRRLEALEQQAPPEQPAAPEPLKTLKDFDYDEQQYNGYLKDTIKAEVAAELRAEVRGEQHKTEAQRRQDAFQAREDAFEAESPGFKERLHKPDLMITNEMAVFISDPSSDVGLHVGDFLATNPSEAARIAALEPTSQMREMVKLESKVSKEVAKVKAEKSKASNAPPPPSGIDGTDPGFRKDPTNPADADKMSDEEWRKARDKQLYSKK